MLRRSIALGVTQAERSRSVGARKIRTSVSSGVPMKSAHPDATAIVRSISAAPTARFTETTAPGMSGSTRGRWINALEKP